MDAVGGAVAEAGKGVAVGMAKVGDLDNPLGEVEKKVAGEMVKVGLVDFGKEVADGMAKVGELGIPLGGTVAILKKMTRKEKPDWKDAKDFLSDIPSVKDSLQILETGAALAKRAKYGDFEACRQKWQLTSNKWQRFKKFVK